MESFATSNFKLGIISGGQLGKMLVLASSKWDVNTSVLDPDENCPASSCANNFFKGDYKNYEDVYKFGKRVDMITFEIENVNIEALKQLRKEGLKIHPDPDILELIKDKGLQKEFYSKNNIPTSSFQFYNSSKEIILAVENGKIKFPFIQKMRIGGYDGKGVVVLNDKNDLQNLIEAPSIVEDCIKIKKEISVIAARNSNGEIKCFPAVEMEFNQAANLVEQLVCPALIDKKINEQAISLAIQVITSLKCCGLIAVEMFLDTQDKLWINEIAPRPHNSGHHTIESTTTSQYEQLLRAIFNFPLGSTSLIIPSVMVNLLGERDFFGPVVYEGLKECMGIDGVKIHLYGKKETRPFRKMGHATILSKSIDEAKSKAKLVKEKLKIKSWKNQL